MSTETPTAVPFAELADPPANYELSCKIEFAFSNYQCDDAGDWPSVVTGYYALDAGREEGRWRVNVYPILGENEDGENVYGEDVVNVRDQHHGPDPLLLLRALLSGLDGGSEAGKDAANVGLRIALEGFPDD